MLKKPSVFFISSRNSARSQMAEAWLRQHAGEKYESYSAGLINDPLDPLAVETMLERGVDLRSQKSQTVASFLKQSFTYLVTVSHRAEENTPIFPSAIYHIYWPFADPTTFPADLEQKKAHYRTLRDTIEQRILEFLADPAQFVKREPRAVDGMLQQP